MCEQRLQNELKLRWKRQRALDRAEAAELKKENERIAAQKKLRKQLHKELRTYLKARPALANR